MSNQILEIPTTMEKFFGCSGKMIKPSAEIVRTIVKKIPKGNLATLDQLREKLSQDFKVQAACPASTTKALQTLSIEDKPVCYWRVIKKDGELISKFPNGIQGHAALLEKEGFEINSSKKNPTVIDYASKLVKLV